MPAGVVLAAQESVRDVVVAAASGRPGHRWAVPLAAAAAVAAAACVPVAWPLLVGGGAAGSTALAAVFAQVGGVGGGLLADAVGRAWDRLRGRTATAHEDDLREALAAELREALASSSPSAAGLRAEVAGVLQGVDAVKVALTTTIETSAQKSGAEVRALLISGLQDLGTRFAEFGWLLEEVNDQVARIAETQAEIAAGTRTLLEIQQQTLMHLTVLLQQTRAPHGDGGSRPSVSEVVGLSADEERATAIDAAGVPVGSECPYPGLAAFRPQDAERFFGRQRLTANLLTRLAEQLTEPGLLMVVGPSGSGKSSLLGAGLLPAIAAGGLPARGSRTWPLDIMTPGRRPLLELATRVAAIASIPAGALYADLDADPARITATIRQALLAHQRRAAQSRGQSASNAVVEMDELSAAAGYPVDDAAPSSILPSPRLVLVVDQFEEVFTQCKDEQERRAFIRALCAAAGAHETAPRPGRNGKSVGRLSSRDAPALVVIGMRADFYARSVTYPDLVPYLQDCQMLVGAMDEDELRGAIEEPAALAGLVVDAGLVELLLADLGLHSRPAYPASQDDRPDESAGAEASDAGTGNAAAADGGYEAGRLPLLAFALQRTWQYREGRRLTVAAYRATGGIDTAVATAADAVYEELDAAGRQAARQLLLGLVSLGEGTADTRRRLAITELTGTADLTSAADSAQAVTARTVLADLIQARLLTADTGTDGNDTVEISHEALLSAWPKLQEWLSQDRSGLRTHRDLSDVAHAWLAESRDSSRLFAGTRLAVAREWADSHDGDLNPGERDFLAACERRGRDIRRRRSAVAALITVLVLSLLISGYVLIERNLQVKGLELQATDKQITAEAVQLQLTDPTTAGQLALVEYERDPSSNNASLLYAATDISLSDSGTSHGGPVWNALFGESGQVLAVGDGGTIQLWNVTDPARPRLASALPGPASGFGEMAFSQDGSMSILASVSGNAIQLWDVTNPSHATPIGSALPSVGEVTALAFNSTGRILASGSSDGTIELWNVANPAEAILTRELVLPPSASSGEIAFSPGSRLLASGGSKATLLWDVETEPRLVALISSTNVRAVAFSPDGRILAVGSGAGTIQLWGIANSERPTKVGRLLTFTTASVNAVNFSPAGTTLVAGSEDGTVRIWVVSDPTHAEAVGLPVADPSPVSSVAYSPNGYTLAVGSTDGTTRLWNLNVRQAITRICTTSHNLTRAQWAAYVPQLPYAPPCRVLGFP